MKALGVQLGRFVLVFCCDETFDFQAMGRIFVGLCQVGAWGCFDEFNRLEERILSAVSQQVQTIQQGLANLVQNPNTEIELVGKNLKINKNIGTFFFELLAKTLYSDLYQASSSRRILTMRGVRSCLLI